MKFQLGKTVMTRGVADFIEENSIQLNEIGSLLARHVNGDWGDVDEEDKETNDYALENNNRLMSVYTLNGEKVWVITEADRSTTTLLFPNEY